MPIIVAHDLPGAEIDLSNQVGVRKQQQQDQEMALRVAQIVLQQQEQRAREDQADRIFKQAQQHAADEQQQRAEQLRLANRRADETAQYHGDAINSREGIAAGNNAARMQRAAAYAANKGDMQKAALLSAAARQDARLTWDQVRQANAIADGIDRDIYLEGGRNDRQANALGAKVDWHQKLIDSMAEKSQARDAKAAAAADLKFLDASVGLGDQRIREFKDTKPKPDSLTGLMDQDALHSWNNKFDTMIKAQNDAQEAYRKALSDHADTLNGRFDEAGGRPAPSPVVPVGIASPAGFDPEADYLHQQTGQIVPGSAIAYTAMKRQTDPLRVMDDLGIVPRPDAYDYTDTANT